MVVVMASSDRKRKEFFVGGSLQFCAMIDMEESGLSLQTGLGGLMLMPITFSYQFGDYAMSDKPTSNESFWFSTMC